MIDSLACWTGVFGALLLALNLSVSKYAYLLFLISSILWAEYGARIENKNIVYMNYVFAAINVIGIIRWIL